MNETANHHHPNPSPITAAPTHACRRGFTLIELLVVIAVIALLVSILLPSLNKAKELAKRLECMSLLKHLGIGFNFYREDYGMYPIPLSLIDPNTGWPTWGSSFEATTWYRQFAPYGMPYVSYLQAEWTGGWKERGIHCPCWEIPAGEAYGSCYG